MGIVFLSHPTPPPTLTPHPPPPHNDPSPGLWRLCRGYCIPAPSHPLLATPNPHPHPPPPALTPTPRPQVLENLKNRAEELVSQHVPEELARSLLKPRASVLPGGRPSFSARASGGGAGLFASSAAVLEDGDPYATAPAAGAAPPVGGAPGPLSSASPATSSGSGGGGGGDGGLSRRGRLPGSGLSSTSVSAFARAAGAARALSAPQEDALEGTDTQGAAGTTAGAAAPGGGGGGGRRLALSSLSMPLRGTRRAAAALEGIPSAAAVEDGEGAGAAGGGGGRDKGRGSSPVPCCAAAALPVPSSPVQATQAQ
jgi:hypothetical protein